MKYKVGDKVRVRGDLKYGEHYGGVLFCGNMMDFKNKIAEITKSEDGYYGLSIDNISYTWTDEMLRPAEFKIWCETEEELKAVLDEINNEKYFEKHEAEYWHIAPVGIIVEEIKNEHQCVVRQCIYKSCFDEHYGKLIELTPSEFTGIDFSHKSKKIIIEQTKTGAKATYKDKWSYVEGDFEDASRQALAEVLCPFKVGDRVQLKRNSNLDGEVAEISANMLVRVVGTALHARFCFDELEPYTEPLYNAKLFCIEGSSQFKKGVIYEIKDGKFIPENSFLLGNDPFEDIENVNKRLKAQFMEVKGGLDE